jgi:putative transposase
VGLVEDLNIKGMMKNHSWAKAVQDQGWSSFVSILEYKLKWNSGLLHKIDRWAASTKTCSNCGHKQPMTLDERTYVCGHCSNEMQRDHNSAINIKYWGINEVNTAGTAEINACGDPSCGEVIRNDETSGYGSMNQESFLRRKEATILSG